MKTSFFKNVSNLEELRKEYRRLAFLHHPDKGGNTQTMQQINAEYDYLSKNLIFCNETFTDERKDYETFVSESMKEKINDLINIAGITLEIIGSWLWVTGLTYPVREKLKSAGFSFSHNKVAWFFHVGEYRKRSRNRYELDDIRNMFGSQVIENEQSRVNQLAY
jgi:hypothetical protein